MINIDERYIGETASTECTVSQLETGWLLLEVPKDDAFVWALRQLVPSHGLSTHRYPWGWLVHPDWGREALQLCREFFDTTSSVMTWDQAKQPDNPLGEEEDDKWLKAGLVP